MPEVSFGSDIYDLKSLVAAVPYDVVLSSLVRLPAVKPPLRTGTNFPLKYTALLNG